MVNSTSKMKFFRWTDDSSLLNKPLLTGLRKGEHDHALLCYKAVLKYMHDRKSSRKDTAQAQQILSIGVRGSNEMREEIFLQIIKQLTLNPSRESMVLGWQLLTICCGTFAPS